MQELLLINPRKRRKSTKAASPAQKRARAKFAAAARARSASPKRKTRRAKRRVSAYAQNPISAMHTPKRRRKARKSAARVSSRRRRNPGRSLLKGPMSILSPALMGALGSTAVELIMGKLPLPASMTTGYAKHVTNAAAAIGLAMIAKKLGVRGALATQMAEGSLTVTLAAAIKDVAASAGMPLNGMGMYLPGLQAQMIPRGSPARLAGMGAYVTGPGANIETGRVRSGMRGMQF